MLNTTTLVNRNQQFSKSFDSADLPILPKLRTVVLACGDSRVDPAHVLGLELGDAVVIRNNGGRVTQEVINEITALAFIVAQVDGDNPGPFELIIIQHTQCGAERFADPMVQQALRENLGIDVTETAIDNHEKCLLEDIEKLKHAQGIPGRIIVSGFIYDVKDGKLQEVVSPAALAA